MKRSMFALVVVVAAAGFARAQSAETSAAAAAPEKCKIVVLNLVGRALAAGDTELPIIVTESLAGEVGIVSGCDVVSQGDIIAMLDYERQKAVCTDGSDSCLAEVGQALGADRVVAGTIGKLGADFILTARLMNVRKGSVEARAEEPVSTGPEQLRRAARNVGRRLFGAKDLAPDAGVATLPHTAGTAADAPPATDARNDTPGLLWAGAAVGGIGVVGALIGGGLALTADGRLGVADETGKDAVRSEGLVALGVAGAGFALALAGAILAAVAWME
jgi:hypothetical protein